MKKALLALTLSACASAGGSVLSTSLTTSPPVGSSSTTAPPTTEASTSTTTVATPGSSVPGGLPSTILYKGELEMEITGPAGRGEWPVVVLVHGGGWLGGDHTMMEALADHLTASGVLVFNGDYRTIGRGGQHPETFEDVACMVATGRALAPTYTDLADHITLVGYSAGAHLGAVVALSENRFANDCPVEADSTPDGFVGLAGPYDSNLFGFLLTAFFGTRFDEDPRPWEEGNPYTYVGGNPKLEALLVHGTDDEVVFDTFTESFATRLDSAGYEVDFVSLEGMGHRDVIDPAVVGELILGFVRG